MFSALSSIPAVNTYVFAAVMVVASYVAFVAGRAAYQNVGRSVWKRSLRWVSSALLSALVVGALTFGRWVPDGQIGVGTKKVYDSGWHVYPEESFVTLPRAGMFNIPYPDDRRFLEISYLITDSERLKFFCEEIRVFKTPVAEGVVLFGTSKRDAWKLAKDPFAAWLLWKTSKYLPNEYASSAEIETFISYLAMYGISVDARLLVQQWRGKR
jgi:hypothetical protein